MKSSENKVQFTFIDLFAGIGGMRLAFEANGGRCVFSCEIDKFAQKTYSENFSETPVSDITKINEKDVPTHDILVGGFPCQAFSIAGKRCGFKDTRGTLFFDAARIIKEKQPKAFLFENVKGLINHAGGQTLKTILSVLRNDLGYYVPEPQILNAKNFGVPQNRERIFIAGFRKDIHAEKFLYPAPTGKTTCFDNVREKTPVNPKYYLSAKYLDCLERHKNKHKAKGNGFGYETIDGKGIANAIVTGGMGRERNLVFDDRVTNLPSSKNNRNIRRMTPREWARLQGFPENFKITVSDTQAYKQFGNSVAVPAVKAIAENIIKILAENRINNS